MRRLVALTCLSLLLSLSSCQRTADLPVFRLGVVSWVGFGPAFVGVEQRLFEKEGVRVEVKRIEETAQLRAALVSKDLDAIIGTADSFASGAAAGLPAKVVLKVDESYGSDALVVSSRIKKITDLKGKQVAFAQGLPSHFFLLSLLDTAGMTSRDIVPVYMEAAEAGAAFAAERIEAAVTWEPWVTQALKRPGAHTLASTRTHPGVIVDLIAVHADVAQQRRGEIKAFLRGWFTAVERIETDPAATHPILAKAFGVPAAEIAGMLTGLRFSSREENRRFFGLEGQRPVPFEEVFQKASEAWRRERLIKATAPATTWYDPEPLRALSQP